jgi:hypothetical protein
MTWQVFWSFFFFYIQETLLVHQDLVHSGGLNELIADLRTEGRNSMIAATYHGYVIIL